MRCQLLALFLNILWIFWVGLSDAAERYGVVILSPIHCCPERRWPEAEAMIQKELSLLDIHSTLADARTLDNPEASTELIRTAEMTRADAVLSVFLLPGPRTRVATRIYDRITDKTVVRTWPAGDVADSDAAMVAGLRIVDTLRASLLEIQMEKKVSEPKRQPVEIHRLAPTTAVEADQRQTMSLSAGAAVGGSIADVFLAGFDGTLGWYPIRYGGLALSVSYLPFGKEISKGGVHSDLDLLSVRGWLVWRILNKGRLRPDLMLGGGGLVVFAEGLVRSCDRMSPTWAWSPLAGFYGLCSLIVCFWGLESA